MDLCKCNYFKFNNFKIILNHIACARFIVTSCLDCQKLRINRLCKQNLLEYGEEYHSDEEDDDEEGEYKKFEDFIIKEFQSN